MKSLKNRPIGIFDSGVGGLTVAKSVRKHLPYEDIIYFGDTARVPYGNKSKGTVVRFAHEIMAFMAKKNVKAVVVACNTASSFSLLSLRKAYSVPIIGVIAPGVKEAVRVSTSGKIGVIGTNSTISSGAYNREISKAESSCRLFSKSCPLFVPLVENRFINDTITYQIARKHLAGLKKKNIDTLILGCTHYPVLKSAIQKVMGKTRLVDSSFAAAKEIKKILHQKELAVSGRKRSGEMKCYVTDDAESFCKTAGIFLKEEINAKKVAL